MFLVLDYYSKTTDAAFENSFTPNPVEAAVVGCSTFKTGKHFHLEYTVSSFIT